MIKKKQKKTICVSWHCTFAGLPWKRQKSACAGPLRTSPPQADGEASSGLPPPICFHRICHAPAWNWVVSMVITYVMDRSVYDGRDAERVRAFGLKWINARFDSSAVKRTFIHIYRFKRTWLCDVCLWVFCYVIHFQFIYSQGSLRHVPFQDKWSVSFHNVWKWRTFQKGFKDDSFSAWKTSPRFQTGTDIIGINLDYILFDLVSLT